MLTYSAQVNDQLAVARRVFGVLPLLVFLAALAVFAGIGSGAVEFISPAHFALIMLRVLAISSVAGIISVAAYGIYRYRVGTSYGL